MARKVAFADGEYYHVFNRGVDKRKIFLDQRDLDRFLESLTVFNTQGGVGSIWEYSFHKHKQFGHRMSKSELALVDVICYCLNPNHFHLLLRQRDEGSIGEFVRRVVMGYTKYFNHKNKRSGVLFQGRTKSVHITSNEQLLHVSAYINLNNRVHHISSTTFRSSWSEYLKNNKGICKKDIILKQFKNVAEYKDFAESSLGDIIERKQGSKELEKMLLE